jgi:hypothetical protein
MDFTEVLTDSSKELIIKVTQFVVENPIYLPDVYALSLAEIPKFSPRAARIIEYLDIASPILLESYVPDIIQKLSLIKSEGVRRCFCKIISSCNLQRIDDDKLGRLVDTCFRYICSAKEPISIKYYSMAILEKVIEFEPDLKGEYKLTLETQLPFLPKGLAARTLKRLKEKY